MTAHRHAKLMAQYAQDAMETDKPWERWQVRLDSGEWHDLTCEVSFLNDCEFRRKPRTININGIEVPEPEREALEDGDEYWSPCIIYAGGDSLLVKHIWDSDSVDLAALSRGLIHLTREAAEIHAKALLSFTEEKAGLSPSQMFL
jgi:hypothetical protein